EQLENVLRHIRKLTHGQSAEGASDAELLRQFVVRRDGDAFAELVRRHGPMVFGVCHRLLPVAQDAEDAFQATFLVLVRRAAALLTESASAVPPALLSASIHLVPTRAGAGSVSARALADGVLRAMSPTRLNFSLFLLLLGTAGVVAGLLPAPSETPPAPAARQ